MGTSDPLDTEVFSPHEKVTHMKRFLFVLAALVVFASSEAQAQKMYYRSNYRPARTYSNYSYNNYNYNSGYSQGPFSRLMELERAKNAWLRSTFMGY
jgi:hypothetical protein